MTSRNKLVALAGTIAAITVALVPILRADLLDPAPTFDDLLEDRETIQATVDTAVAEVADLQDDDPQSTETLHLADMDLQQAQARRMAVDLTRFFAKKHGLDMDEALPEPLALEYEKFTTAEVTTEEYLNTIKMWIDRKPTWVE